MSIQQLIADDGLLNEEGLVVQLFFIQRRIKVVKKVQNFIYDVKKTDASDKLNDFFIKSLKAQIGKVVGKPDVKFEDYKVIADDSPNVVHRYPDANAMKVAPSLWGKIEVGAVENIKSLHDVKDKLWAYCVKLSKGNKSVLVFRKIAPTKIATDEAQTSGEKFLAWFDSDDARLVEVKLESVSFDDKFDCVLLDNTFYIFGKGAFEKIVSLEDEFVENANTVVAEMTQQNILEGIELLQEEISAKPSLMRMVANIARKQNHTGIGQLEIENMKNVLHTFEKKDLKFTADGKIFIENKEDVEDFLKLLNDYHKKGMVSGKFYGSSSGHVITAQ
ncbi:Kiwa anti-phage protein KwaB-like domain-containing protein [Pseudomonas gingeri]|uniref:Kiwa anti-phage protein KwaB-like domain-containing protein n=1 Tax=Pseudomonas gingeri TaxID=117681 RepID=UPI0015B80871|nr:Kiwa anti-phage protein KwaB-like domain-containing protein [Pseudomonas gingeri]NWD51682.1 DUF4868 domain-containing protein [Pseudomonas gingeri]